MAVGTTLDEMVTMLRSETGQSTNAAMGINMVTPLYTILRRAQEFYYNDFAWPFLIKRDFDEDLIAGERFYSFNADLDQNRISQAWVKHNGTWQPVQFGITPNLYNTHDSENDERMDPVLRWDYAEEGQFEVWPIPATNYTMRFKGMRKLKPLVSGTDVSTLDAQLIVLYAAAEMLADRKGGSAQIKMTAANELYRKLKAQASKETQFVMGQPGPSSDQRPKNWSIRAPRT